MEISIGDFYDEVKKICDNEHFCNIDKLSEIGELLNEFNITTNDLQKIVNEYSTDYYIQTFVKPQLDFEKGIQFEQDKARLKRLRQTEREFNDWWENNGRDLRLPLKGLARKAFKAARKENE